MTLADARLLIHAQGVHGESHRAGLLQWLRALCTRGADAGRGPLHLQIADLQGNVILTREDAGVQVGVSLPAGTYRVTAQFGTLRRDYTLTLQSGTAFDLYLQPANEKP